MAGIVGSWAGCTDSGCADGVVLPCEVRSGIITVAGGTGGAWVVARVSEVIVWVDPVVLVLCVPSPFPSAASASDWGGCGGCGGAVGVGAGEGAISDCAIGAITADVIGDC